MMLIHDYGIMIVKSTLNDRFKKLRFANTIYVSDFEVILIAFNKLKKKNFYEICIMIR